MLNIFTLSIKLAHSSLGEGQQLRLQGKSAAVWEFHFFGHFSQSVTLSHYSPKSMTTDTALRYMSTGAEEALSIVLRMLEARVCGFVHKIYSECV